MGLGIVSALAVFSLGACGEQSPESAASAAPEASGEESVALPEADFEYVDPDAQYATKIAQWEAKVDGEKGAYAAKLAKQEGWRGDDFALRDVAIDTCLNLTKYQDGTYTAFYAWTYILNDVGRGNLDLPRTKQALVASYFVGATCPELGDVMTDALEEAFESAGGL